MLGIGCVAALGLFVAFVLFQLWLQRPGNRPSDFFRQLDRDRSGHVSFEEWQAMHRDKMDARGREWDFHHMDCNEDWSLTWGEYRNNVFWHRQCEPARVESRRPEAPGSFSKCWTDPVSGAQHCVVGSSSGSSANP